MCSLRRSGWGLLYLFSLGLGKDFTVHDGGCGDASCHRVNLEQAAHTRWLNGVGHLTVLALVHILGNHLGKKVEEDEVGNMSSRPRTKSYTVLFLRVLHVLVPVWSAFHIPVPLSWRLYSSAVESAAGCRWHPAGSGWWPWKRWRIWFQPSRRVGVWGRPQSPGPWTSAPRFHLEEEIRKLVSGGHRPWTSYLQSVVCYLKYFYCEFYLMRSWCRMNAACSHWRGCSWSPSVCRPGVEPEPEPRLCLNLGKRTEKWFLEPWQQGGHYMV